MKKHIYYLAGLFFIWVVPIICLIVMACTGATSGIKLKTWITVALVIMIFIYYFRGKQEIGKIKDRQLLKQDYVAWYIRVIEWLMVMIPFVCGLLLVENVKANINEAITFLIICMCSVSLGYIFLCVDSKQKEKVKLNNDINKDK